MYILLPLNFQSHLTTLQPSNKAKTKNYTTKYKTQHKPWSNNTQTLLCFGSSLYLHPLVTFLELCCILPIGTSFLF